MTRIAPVRLAARASALAVVLAAAFASPAMAQDAPPKPPAPAPDPAPAAKVEGTVDDELIITTPKDGMTLMELLEAVNRQAARSIILESKVREKIKKETIQFVGTYKVPRSRLFDWLQGVLSFSSYILIPIGPDTHSQWMVVEMTNQGIRSRPTYVDEKELDAWKDRDGVYIVCTLRAKSLDANDAQRARTAIQQLMSTTNNLGRINEVPGQNAFIIADFAPVVYAAKKLLEAMDVPLLENKQILETVRIHNAQATDIESMLTDLLSSVTATGQPRRPQNPAQVQTKPDPQIIADNRTNSLILYAVPEDIDRIKVLIGKLDTEFRGKSRIHFRMLQYQVAKEVQEILESLISGTASSSSSGSSGFSRSRSTSRSRTTSSTTQPGQPPGAFAGTPTEGEPVIIADEKNNSLIIHATEDQVRDLSGLIDKLDRPRKQVLIETALMELSVGDQLDVGVDLFGVPEDIAVDTNGDGIVDTFTDAKSYFAASFFGNSQIINQPVPPPDGVNVPTGVSPILDNSLKSQGFTAGIFNNGKIPIIIHALQSRSPSKIVTMPSIVTSDNQSATIKTTDTVPYLTTTFVGPNSTPQTTFESVDLESSLTISPSISADDFLRLNIRQQVANAGPPPAVGAKPPTTTRDIQTELMVPNAATVVLGGIISTQESETLSGVPILMDIPLLGFLFRTSSTSHQRTNLFLFVTPTIMNDLKSFSDFHKLTWEKKVQAEKLFGEEVDLLGTKFLGPDVPRSALEAVLRIDGSGTLDAYRYGIEPSDAERLDSTRRAWERMQREKDAKDAKDAPAPGDAPKPVEEPKPVDAPKPTEPPPAPEPKPTPAPEPTPPEPK